MPQIKVMLGDNEVNRYSFDKDIVSIGRSRDNDIVIENLAISRNHARIRRDAEGRFILSDLNSANGTLVNGVRITKTEIMSGDTIGIGKHRLRFEDDTFGEEALIGEAFTADRTMLVEKTPDARLTVRKGKQKGQEFKVTKYETTVGRSASENDICIHDWFVSKRHALIIRQGNKFFIKDVGSWRGTILNNAPIKESPLVSGDVVKIGTTLLEFHVAPQQEALPLAGRVPVELEMDSRKAIAVGTGQLFEVVPHAAAMRAPAPLKADGSESVRKPIGEPSTQAPGPKDDGSWRDVTPPRVEEVLETGERPQPVISPRSGKEETWAQAPGTGALATGGVPFPMEDKPAPSPVSSQPESAAIAAGAGVPASGRPVVKSSEEEVALWERALQNRSKAIRMEAARMLKKLTGKDYEVSD